MLEPAVQGVGILYHFCYIKIYYELFGRLRVPGKIEIMIPLLAAMVFGCAPQPGKTLPNSEVGNSPIPLLDQGIPQELATATFALG